MNIDGQRAAILWPPHYTATFEPAAVIFDEEGQRVARAGDALTTVMLGPDPKDADACGLTAVVQVYFDKVAASPTT